MVDVGEEEEYESDLEQAKLSLKMRRRRGGGKASDDGDRDYEGGGGVVGVRERVMVVDSRVSDYESDGKDEEEFVVENKVKDLRV